MNTNTLEKIKFNIKPNNSWKSDQHYLFAMNDPWYRVILKIQHDISLYTALFYENEKMKTLHLPITTGSISSPMGLGSDSSPVKVNICGLDTYLADSMQFMLEYGCRIFKEGCYYLMPSFRGEEADERHLCQFFHSEAEIVGNLNDVILLVERYLKYLCEKIIVSCGDDIYNVTNDLSHIERIINIQEPIARITLDDALKLLEENGYKEECYTRHKEGFRVLNSYGEKKLIELFNGIVWLTHFEHISVPFYQAFDENNREKALNADLLFGIGEVVGAGERHETETQVIQALKEHSVDAKEYEWYINMKKEHPLKTSGFGMGIERFILWLLKHDDIRDCQLIPRFNGVNILP